MLSCLIAVFTRSLLGLGKAIGGARVVYSVAGPSDISSAGKYIVMDSCSEEGKWLLQRRWDEGRK